MAAMENIKTNKLIYHLTRLDNLYSILKNGLLPRKKVLRKIKKFSDVADPNIITERTLLGLDEYVPFHFHPYSSFDADVKATYPDDEFVYICVHRKDAEMNGYKIIPIHPLSLDEVVLYDYDEGFDLIDWDTMHELGTETKYKKNVKMAECLKDDDVYASEFFCIYVRDEETKEYVEDILEELNIGLNPPYVNIKNWF